MRRFLDVAPAPGHEYHTSAEVRAAARAGRQFIITDPGHAGFGRGITLAEAERAGLSLAVRHGAGRVTSVHPSKGLSRAQPGAKAPCWARPKSQEGDAMRRDQTPLSEALRMAERVANRAVVVAVDRPGLDSEGVARARDWARAQMRVAGAPVVQVTQGFWEGLPETVLVCTAALHRGGIGLGFAEAVSIAEGLEQESFIWCNRLVDTVEGPSEILPSVVTPTDSRGIEKAKETFPGFTVLEVLGHQFLWMLDLPASVDVLTPTRRQIQEEEESETWPQVSGPTREPQRIDSDPTVGKHVPDRFGPQSGR